LFVTNHVPPDRAGAFAALHARVPLELALFGGRSHHATEGLEDPGVPHRHVAQREVLGLAASGAHHAVVCGTAGRAALPAAWHGARRGGVPFVLWSALWAPLRTPAHLAAAPLLRRIHETADAVVTYGPHVSAHARSLGARVLHVAPQAVDASFWGATVQARDPGAPFTAVWVGRPARAKGLEVLMSAWQRMPAGARLELVGVTGREAAEVARGTAPAPGITAHGQVDPSQVRNFLGLADVVVVPSIATRAFREPWALVANEAMHQGTPVIATDAVGAAAGGLVRDGRNGLVVPAGDVGALAAALTRLRDDRGLRASLGAAARRDVAPYTFEAWATGFEQGLAAASARFGHGSRGSSCR
jgi:glycosyltransferase involved in cell wall biosynthesis